MITWYKHLSINQRINLKLCFEMLVGVEFGRLGQIFSLRERIEIAYTKLEKEGFDMSIIIS